MGKLMNWFRELSPVQRLVMGGGITLGVLTGIYFLAGGFEGVIYALVVGGVVGLALYGLHWFLKYRQKKRKSDFDIGLVADIKQARAEIGDQFERAFQELKSSNVDVYQLPWYFFIGEPQSGKTFTIKTSGVELPLGTQGISGAGGTRDCDFWFTNEAVILDTAGRLTVQEDEVIDREQWNEVLRFLGRTRPNCPINGVILGIPTTSLLEDDSETLAKKADVIQKRLKELQTSLKIHFPVFLVILKSDLVLGFEPFFKRLPVLERKQLFGWSNPARFDQPYNPESFDRAFDGILTELHSWRLKFMNDESATEAINQFYVFPEEFMSLKKPIRETLDKIFVQGPFGQAGFFRGFYFTSSLQEGRAIPFAIRSVLGGIGEAEQDPVPDLGAVQARSTPFFVRDFYMKKTFPEKGLLLRTDRSRLVNTLIRGASLWGGAAVLLIGVLILVLRTPTVGNKLDRPESLVEAVKDNTKNTEEPLEVSGELGDLIDTWKSDPGSAPAALFEYFFPEPSHDTTLIGYLEEAFRHRLWHKHLGPFFRDVQNSIQGSKKAVGAGSGRIETWADFEKRSRALVELAGTAMEYKDLKSEQALKKGVERFKTLVRTASLVKEGDRNHSQAYYDDLAREYGRFLKFGGQPAKRLKESEGSGGGEALWSRIQTLSEPCTAFCFEALSEKKLDEEDYGIGLGDAVCYWRHLIQAADRFKHAYEALVKITPLDSQGKPRTPDVVKAGDHEQLAGRWKPAFAGVKNAWDALTSHLARAETHSLLEEDLGTLKKEIDAFFNVLISQVLAGSQEAGVKMFRSHLEKQKEKIDSRFEVFRRKMRGRFSQHKQVLRIAGTMPENGGKATVEKGTPPAGPAKAAQLVWQRLNRLDDCVTGNPDDTTREWDTAEKRKESIQTFPAKIRNQFQTHKKMLTLDLAIDEKFWKKDRLEELTDHVAAVSLTRLFHEVFKTYYGWATETGSAAPSNRLPFYGWFAVSSPEGAPRDLFRGRREDAFLKGCFEAHAAHVEQLVAFLEMEAVAEKGKPAKKKYLLLDKGTSGIKGKLEGLMRQYENRYLDYWKSEIEGMRLWRDDSFSYDRKQISHRTWIEFKDHVRDGFGHSSIGHLADNALKNSIKYALDHVSVTSLDQRKKSNHLWAVALEAYKTRKGLLDNVSKVLKEYGALVKSLDDKAVKAMLAARDARGEWLDTKIESLVKQYPDADLGSDLFARKLRDLGKQGKVVLQNECRSQFEKDWKAFSTEYHDRMDGKFPFDGDRKISDEDTLKKMKDEQVKPDDLRLLLDPDGIITKLLEKYWGCFPTLENSFGFEARPARSDFLKACRSLRNLIFKKGSGEFRRVKFAVFLPGEPGGNIRKDITEGGRDVLSLKKTFAIRFRAGPASRPVRLWAGDSESNRYDSTWTFAKDEKGGMGAAVAVLGKDRKVLVADGRDLKFGVKGPWAFLLFLRAYGTPIESVQSLNSTAEKKFDRKLWFVRKELGVDKEDRGYIILYFLVELDEPLEPLPNWRRARSGE